MAVKLVYGVGAGMAARGVTLFQRWQNGEPAPLDLVEVCAAGEESPVQLAGTTVHELAHVMAGWGAGHDREWKRAAGELGLRHAEAAGQDYTPDHFDPDLWAAIAALGEPSDGRPAFARIGASGGPLVAVPGVRPTRSPRPCSLGIGTRGGRSRGPGSGSRLRLWVCACPVRVRVASDDFRATCGRCGETFTRGGAS